MGTFKALWLLRKETFSRKGERDSIGSRIFLASGEIFIFASACSLFVIMGFSVIIGFAGSILGIVLGVSLTAALILTFIFFYQGPFAKTFSDESYPVSTDYTYMLNSLSSIDRLNRFFSIFGLELRFEEHESKKIYGHTFYNPFTLGKLELFYKGTDTKPKDIFLTSNDYDSSPSISFMNVKKETVVERKFELTQMAAFSNANRYLVRKAFSFWLAEKYLKKDLSAYSSLWLQLSSLKPILMAVKLDILPEKLVQLMKLGVEVENYEDTKDLPISWLEKAYKKELTPV